MAAGDDGGGAFLLDMLHRRAAEVSEQSGRLALRVKRDETLVHTDHARRQMTAARILGRSTPNDEAAGEREFHRILSRQQEPGNFAQSRAEDGLAENPQESESSARSRQGES